MMGHKICFYGEMWLMISELSLLALLIWSTDLVMNGPGLQAFYYGCANIFEGVVLIFLKAL